MRYYDITMTDPDGNLLDKFGFAKSGYKTNYTSYLNGGTISGALNVEFNIPQGPFATPQQGSWLRIWGVGLDELASSSILGPPDGRLCGITIQAGFQKGLPLAKPSQKGTILQGSIFKPFGNWQGTDQTLEMVLLPAVGVPLGQTVNIPFNYKANSSLSDAIDQALGTGLPKYSRSIKISDSLKLSYDSVGSYPRLAPFAAWLNKISLDTQFQGLKPLGGGKYGGIQVRLIGNTITVYDGTKDYGNNTYSKPKQIQFEDVIGQPTWIGPNSINFKCPMRADINVGDYVTLPTTLAVPYVLTTPGAAIPGAPSRNSLTFKGSFVIVNVRHYANFKSPSADAWVTVYNASYTGDGGSLVGGTAP